MKCPEENQQERCGYLDEKNTWGHLSLSGDSSCFSYSLNRHLYYTLYIRYDNLYFNIKTTLISILKFQLTKLSFFFTSLKIKVIPLFIPLFLSSYIKYKKVAISLPSSKFLFQKSVFPLLDKSFYNQLPYT